MWKKRPIPPIASSLDADLTPHPEAPRPVSRPGLLIHLLRLGKRMLIALAGGVVILAGACMLVLPGPGLVTIALGLALLSLEFERPRIWLAWMKARGVQMKDDFLEARARRRDRH